MAIVADLRYEMPMEVPTINAYIKEANRILREIDKIPDEPRNPAEMARKLDLYVDFQFVVGELHSNAVYEKNMAYQRRKENFFVARDSFAGTESAKDAYAEMRVAKDRREEARATGQAKRWENMFTNAEQKANSLKKRAEILFYNLKSGNGEGGGW